MVGFGHHFGPIVSHLWGHVGPSWWLCCSVLEATMAHFGGYDGPSWSLVVPCLVLVGISKTQTALKRWRSQKMENTMKNGRFWPPSWLYVSHLWGCVGPSWRLCWSVLEAPMAHLGGYDGPSWGFIAPCLVLVGMSKTQTALKRWRAQKLWKIP